MYSFSWSRALQFSRRLLSQSSQKPPQRRRTTPLFVERLETRVVPAPLVTAISRFNPAPPNTSATSVTYAVTFDNIVTGVDATDFQVTTGGSAKASTPVGVSGGPAVYFVTVAGIHGSGALRLDLVNDGSIKDFFLAPLANSFQGQTYDILQTFPAVVSINRLTPSTETTNAASVTFQVTFSNSVTGVDPTDFQLATTGTVGTTLTQVTAVSASVYNVAVSGITGAGTLGLNLVDDGSIRDTAGNPLTSTSAPASFQNQQTFATGSLPDSVALGDVNGDGKPDLAVANFYSNTVSVLLGNGNGIFQSQQTFGTGTNPRALALGDVNGDGLLDLAVANFSTATVSVLLGNGNGTFQVHPTNAYFAS